MTSKPTHNKVKLIAAVTSDMGIGYNGKLIFNIKEDMQFFKEQTTNHIVVMGSKTFEEIGKPLPNRINIVLSTKEPTNPVDGVIYVKSLDEVWGVCNQYDKTIFFIGGQQVYESALEYADELLLTIIIDTDKPLDNQPKADRFFPDTDMFDVMSLNRIRVDNHWLLFYNYVRSVDRG